MKIGVWGLGSIGLRHAKNALVEGADVIGFDPDRARTQLLEEAGAAVVGSEEELLNAADAIIICSPNHLHFDHLKRCIDADCHVLIEKPMAHRSEGLKELLDQATDKELVIAPAMNMRFDAVVQKAKNIVENRDFGRAVWARLICSAYLPDWRPHQDYKQGYTNNRATGGVIFDIIHEFDIAHYVLGALETQSCHAVNSGLLGLDVEDCADILLKTKEQSVPVSIHLDYISKPGQRRFEIQFENGLMKADLDDRTIEISGQDTLHIQQSDIECYTGEMKNFINAIKGGEPFLCSGHEALEVLDNVIAARKLAGLPQE